MLLLDCRVSQRGRRRPPSSPALSTGSGGETLMMILHSRYFSFIRLETLIKPHFSYVETNRASSYGESSTSLIWKGHYFKRQSLIFNKIFPGKFSLTSSTYSLRIQQRKQGTSDFAWFPLQRRTLITRRTSWTSRWNTTNMKIKSALLSSNAVSRYQGETEVPLQDPMNFCRVFTLRRSTSTTSRSPSLRRSEICSAGRSGVTPATIPSTSPRRFSSPWVRGIQTLWSLSYNSRGIAASELKVSQSLSSEWSTPGSAVANASQKVSAEGTGLLDGIFFAVSLWL